MVRFSHKHARDELSMSRYISKSIVLFIVIAASLGASSGPVKHERWSIKTSLENYGGNPTEIGIAVLAGLPAPKDAKLHEYNNKKLSGVFDGFKEGEFVETVAWLHLAAFSKDDSDYHLQITGDRISGNNCVIVEIPDPRNARSEIVRNRWKADRAFIDSLCHSRRPSEAGTIFKKAVRVRVTGQLFYDLSHGNPASRGKKKMKAVTSWEIHPVLTIGLAKVSE
jgi:hypothetical protein